MRKTKRDLVHFAMSLFLVILLPGTCLGDKLEPLREARVPENNPQTLEKVALGKKLFFDRRLSGDGTMSCATCHIPDQAFTDGQAISLSYPTTRSWRNTPTLLNVVFSTFLFHDGRAGSLEEQALHPIVSPFEMNQNLDLLEEEIRVVPAYLDVFKEVFGSDDITRERIAMALASFERTLVSRNAPLDLFLKGETEALSGDARKGLEIFTGKGRCADCHFGVSLSDNDFHALHVPENPKVLEDPLMTATMRFAAKVNGYEAFRNIRQDLGRFLITKDKKDWRAFKTPTLREIARTAPYMHNGVMQTLDEVIEFFDRGGGDGNRLLEPLGLTAEEKRSLQVFLVEGLSGERITISLPDLP